ncbi:MAG: glycosyltransferase family 39 protein [Phycisphaeraceae bacterium]|nr:glycosyltransferase family 39 protein [Phycisphaeraceae bacterium]
MNPSPPTGASWKLTWLLIAAAAVLIGAINNGEELPMEGHEILVARTAEEMLQRNDWITPYIDGRPRLQKPPVSYWLAMIADRMGDGDGRIGAWEARWPSIVGGAAMVILTMVLGVILFDRWVALIGALLVLSSRGYINYTHRARPEMLYAAFCVAGVIFFASAARRILRRQSVGPALPWYGWLMMGLAVLTKGPLLPLMIAVGWGLGLWRIGRGRMVLKTLRPLSGMLILLAVALWWFALVWWRVKNSEAVWQDDLGAKFVMRPGELLRLLEPFYLYRPAELFLPWVVMYPLLIAAPWLVRKRQRSSVALLWWPMVVTMLLLSLAIGRRSYYMLPLMGPMGLLMAAGTLAVGRALIGTRHERTWRIVWIMHAVVLAAVIIAMRFAAPAMQAPPLWTICLVVAVAIAVIVYRQRGPQQLLAVTAVSAMVFSFAMLFNGTAWGRSRYDQANFARTVAATVPRDQMLAVWSKQPWYTELYHARRPIELRQDVEQLVADVQREGQVWLLMKVDRRRQLKLPAGIAVKLILRESDEDDSPLLVLLSASGPDAKQRLE